MTTKNFTQEQISALVDGEMTEDQLDLVLAALKTPDGRKSWAQYHEIGDVLRSDDMVLPMSSDFTSRLMSRLDNEPTVVAPIASFSGRADTELTGAKKLIFGVNKKRFALSGAAAAVAALAFVVVPQIMVATKTGPAIEENSVVAATVAAPKTVPASAAEATADNGDILRNSDVDEYLLAHQRFSPSVYSTAQYARSATFAVDSEK